MIIFGTLEELRAIQFEEPMIVLNFNSVIEGVKRLQYLNPYWVMNKVFTNEYEFDSWYVGYITTTPEAFKEFIDLMRLVYNGKSVYIICEWNNDISENMIEALIKFIVDNYGYVSNVVKTKDDIYNLVEGTFSSSGIQLFDANMETYLDMFGIKGLSSNE